MMRFRQKQLWCVQSYYSDKKCENPQVLYTRVQTGTNNPQVSQKMRYSQIVGTGAKLRTIHKTNGIGPDGQPLQQRIIVPLTNF
jgi:hypothetical protein